MHKNDPIHAEQNITFMKILICDDSSMARKSLTRTLAPKHHADILYAENGRDALLILTNHQVDILFLDLTMPVMDGFEVLSILPVNDYPTKVIVISGDFQSQSVQRCKEFGAHAFLRKPFKLDEFTKVTQPLGIEVMDQPRKQSTPHMPAVDQMAKFREVVNIAMGNAADKLATRLGFFINMPIAHVAEMTIGELRMAVDDLNGHDVATAVSQRFIGSGVHGEALVSIFGQDVRQLNLGEDGGNVDEIKLDLTNILVSAFLSSLQDQISMVFSQRPPVILDIANGWNGLVDNLEQKQDRFFTIEYVYTAENIDLTCEVLLLTSTLAIPIFEQLMDTL